MIRPYRNHLVAIWLGLFAMLMIHAGPLISSAQALSLVDAVSMHSHHTSSTRHEHTAAQLLCESSAAVECAEQRFDYHALMGHHNVPAGTPQWLLSLEMCGYCDLLTISPPLLLVLVLALPVAPLVQWLAVLPAAPRLLPAAHSLRLPRAPPVHLFS